MNLEQGPPWIMRGCNLLGWGKDRERRPEVLLSMGRAWEEDWSVSCPLGEEEVGEGATN